MDASTLTYLKTAVLGAWFFVTCSNSTHDESKNVKAINGPVRIRPYKVILLFVDSPTRPFSRIVVAMGLALFSWILTTECAIGVVFLLSAFCTYKALAYPSINFPPGPKPLPIIGNALQLPTENLEERFMEWAPQYGDVMHVRIFGQSMVILHSLQAARDLLDKRSSIYSDRPRFVLLSDLMGWKSASTHMRYGPRFRKHRRFINQVFNQKGISTFRPLQEKETLVLLEGMLYHPDDFVDHFRRYAAATILKITYGHDIRSVDDLFVRLAERAGTLTVEAGSAAANLVDFFPVLRHIPTWAPFSTFKRKALETRKAVEAMMDIPFEQVKSDMISGRAVPSYTSTLLDSHREPDGSIAPDDEEDIKGSAGTLLAAAEDTTIASIHTFLLAIVLHPQEFKNVQEEMDRVVGRHRLPTIDDRPSLPYLECLLKEVIRWNPMVPLGIPHRLMEDDIYRDYFIPKGTTVLANIYAILRDCADPDTFCPRRYLNDDSLPDPFEVVFGFGRRICPGRHLAEVSYWGIASSMIAAFDISKALNPNGREINIPLEFTPGFVRHPKPFKCSIKARSPELPSLISHARAELDLQ